MLCLTGEVFERCRQLYSRLNGSNGFAPEDTAKTTRKLTFKRQNKIRIREAVGYKPAFET